MFCHKCGTSLNEDSHFCSKCGTKVDDDRVMNNVHKTIWLLPAVTLLFVVAVFLSFYLYETSINSTVDALVKEGEVKALEGDLVNAKIDFEQVLQKRPQHRVAAFNLEVVERGLYYEELLDEAEKLGEKQQFHNGLRLLGELEPVFAKEEGPFIGRLKERFRLQTASLTVATVDKDESELMIDELANLFEKINHFKSKEASEMAEILRGKIIDLAIEHGQKYLQKNQFTEAEIEFDRALSYDPKNETLLAFKETVKKERVAFEKAEQQRLKQARAKAAEEEQFNRTKAISLLTHEFRFKNDEFIVSGAVKNNGTRPMSEIEIDYTIFDEDGQQLSTRKASINPNLLMPNENGLFKESLLIAEDVSRVEIVDIRWKIH